MALMRPWMGKWLGVSGQKVQDEIHSQSKHIETKMGGSHLCKQLALPFQAFQVIFCHLQNLIHTICSTEAAHDMIIGN